MNNKIINNLIKPGIPSNVLKCSKGKSEKYPHKRLKFEICNFLWGNNIDFVTEAVFMNNSRCDILVKDWGIILEVLSSEKKSDFVKKSYPVGCIPIRTSIHKMDLEKMLVELRDTSGNCWKYYRDSLLEEL